MNKVVFTILVIAIVGILSCDTASNIEPLDESFFIKMYAGIGVGDQEGNDIIATSDGGLLIAGTSVDETKNTSEILLIKTDNKGNEEWKYGAAIDLGATSFSVAKSVIELAGSYLVGGTVDSAGVDRSIIMEIGLAGSLLNATLIQTDSLGTIYSNSLSKLTYNPNGTGILVSGNTYHPIGTDAVNLNGFIRLYDTDLIPISLLGEDIKYFGVEGDDYVTGAYEITDQNLIGDDKTKFIVFGHSDFRSPGGDKDFYYIGFNEFYTESPGMQQVLNTGDEVSNYLTQAFNKFWMMGSSDGTQMFLVGWEFKKVVTDWSPVNGSGEIGDNNASEGKGVAVQDDNKNIIVGDVSFSTDDREIYLARVGANFSSDSSDWPKIFGTSSSAYSSSAVITLLDGSIVIVGTADLEPIKKIIVIKTGPNGEMSF